MYRIFPLIVLVIALHSGAAETNFDTEKVLDGAKSAAAAASQHETVIRDSGIDAAAKALSEERTKSPPDYARLAELASTLASGMKRAADVDNVVDSLDTLREQFHSMADQLRAEANQGTTSSARIAQRLAAPYELKMRTLAARIKECPADGPQARRLKADFTLNLSLRNQANRLASSARVDTGVDMRNLADKYDAAAGAVLVTKRELLIRSMKLASAADQLEGLAVMTRAARALDDATLTVTTLGKASETSLAEVDATVRMLDRIFNTILAKVESAGKGTVEALENPSSEDIDRTLEEYSKPAPRYHYGTDRRN